MGHVTEVMVAVAIMKCERYLIQCPFGFAPKHSSSTASDRASDEQNYGRIIYFAIRLEIKIICTSCLFHHVTS